MNTWLLLLLFSLLFHSTYEKRFSKKKPKIDKDVKKETPAPEIDVIEEEEKSEFEDICPFPWQSHEQNILATFAQCREFEHEGVKCTPHDPIECTGRNPACVFSKMTDDYRCCSDVPQDLSSPPGVPEQVKPICPYGATSYDIPSVLLCDPTEEKSCPDEYTCEQAVNSQMLSTYNMHLCCKTTALDSFENVFYETKVGINKEPVTLKKISLLRDQFPGYFHHVLLLYNPHGNPESMNFYYNRASTLSRDVDLSVAPWDEGVFFRSINRVMTITNDKVSTKQTRKLYIVLVFKTKQRLTRRHPQTWQDLHANYTSFTEFLTTPTGKLLGTPEAGSYFYMTK
ncbi:unnamed protein product, partial [Mesorhabditis belari]|uniref:Uncharacterized protein n=1 Tax=Mesorhabditis belari TaxID=2138241 RepID=A0AAF3JBU1_9BILA